MSAIKREKWIVFDLKLQKKMLPGIQYKRDFMPDSINDVSILLELLEDGRDGGINNSDVVTEGNICRFANNSINYLDNLLDYSKDKSSQEIDFDSLKLKLMDS